MQNKNLFVLPDSFLNNFLYTEVGTEGSSSPLTILSVLARLGKDPWDEAKTLLKTPQAKAVDLLTQDLLKMADYSERPFEARAAADVAVKLLRSGSRKKPEDSAGIAGKISLVLIVCALALGLVCDIMLMTKVPADVLNADAGYMSGW